MGTKSLPRQQRRSTLWHGHGDITATQRRNSMATLARRHQRDNNGEKKKGTKHLNNIGTETGNATQRHGGIGTASMTTLERQH